MRPLVQDPDVGRARAAHRRCKVTPCGNCVPFRSKKQPSYANLFILYTYATVLCTPYVFSIVFF